MRALALVAVASVTIVAVATSAGARGDTSRVSISTTGVEGNQDSSVSSVSGNGNLVVYVSAATNLVPGDTNNAYDIFLRNRTAATTTRVSLTAAGAQSTGDSGDPVISDDGSTIAFWSDAQLTSTPTFGVRQLYVRAGGTTELVSKDSAGNAGTQPSYNSSLSASGRYVAYWSNANNLDGTDWTSDVYRYDRQTGTTAIASVDSAGGHEAPGADSNLPSISADGRFVVFQTLAAFDPADTNGTWDVYLHDFQTGQTTLVSRGMGNTPTDGPSHSGIVGPQISADGSTVVYASDATNIVPGDTNGNTDVFAWDRATGQVQRVSVADDGSQSVGASSSPAVSSDGKTIAFQSSGTLVPWDTDASIDVYVRHLATLPATTTLESTSANGQVTNGDKLRPSLTGDAKVVTYHSASGDLVSGDTNSRYDVFVHELGIADTTPPTVTGTPTTSPNADGWYTHDVQVHWTATDPQPSSGQPPAVPDDTFTTEGKDVTYSATHPACDGNSNCTTGTIKLSIDKTPPNVTATVNQPNSYGWYNGDVVAGFTCSDAISGVATCPGALHFTSEGANQTPPAPLTAVDRAGNTATATIPTVNIDQTPPVIHFGGAQSYDVDGTVAITCTATDALSGLAPGGTCTGVAGPASLFQIGTNTITATVTDKAGNTASASYTFTVQATIGGLERFACALLGTTPVSVHDSSNHDHDNDLQKRLRNLCRQLSDDLEDAQTAAAAGNTKKRDDNVRKFLKDASNAVGRLITADQMAPLTRIATAITAS